MKSIMKKLWENESGATAIEYGLIVGIMAALLVAVLGMFGDKLKDLFGAIADMLGDATDQVKQSSTTP
jgi:pilus assembly protein Flp/PilA